MRPTVHVLPVGNAGNITAYWKGYQEYRAANQTTRLPRMMGFQAAGAAPIVLGHVVENPQTVATAIRIGNPASWQAALTAVKESSGAIDMVTDEEILQAIASVAATEGVFCEPASAASVAGVMKLQRAGRITGRGDRRLHVDWPWIEGCRYGHQRIGHNPKPLKRLGRMWLVFQCVSS